MSSYKDYKEKALNNPEVKTEYDALQPEYDLIQAMIDARNNQVYCGIFDENYDKKEEYIADSIENQAEVYMLTYDTEEDYKNFSANYEVTYMYAEDDDKHN